MTCTTTNDDIDKYLEKVKNIINNNSSNLIISLNRDINRDFMANYSLRKKNVIQIINNLSSNNFEEKVINNHTDFKDEYLYIFSTVMDLTGTKGKTKKVIIYIKFNLLDTKAILVSFHEAKYKFKEKKENENKVL